MSITNEFTTITTNATVIGHDGFVVANAVTVTDHGDGIAVDGTEYPKHELTITTNSITNGCWEASW